MTAEYPPTPGGVADYTAALAAALQALGHEVSIRPRLDREVEGMDLVNLQYVPQLYGRAGIAPGIAAAVARRAARLRGRLVITLHELYSPFREASLPAAAAHRLQLRALLASGAAIVVTNRRAAALVRDRRPTGPVTEIPVGSGVPVVAASADHRLQLRAAIGGTLLAGDLSPFGPHKDPAELAAVAAALGGEARVVLLGGLPRDLAGRRRYDAAVAARGLGGRMFETGYLPAQDVSTHLSLLDLYVHTGAAGASTRSTTLAAALSHGLPVVARRGPETPDYFEDGVNLRLIDPGDSLAAAAAALAADPELRARLGAAGRETHRRHLAWDVIARRLLDAAA
ncbi:MAG: hypothetical protein NVS9B1_18640 [Candidatus Dormibacteraceae bacterium]